MSDARKIEAALRQSIADFFRRRWPITHELIKLQKICGSIPGVQCISPISTYTPCFYHFDPFNPPSNIIEKSELVEYMDYFEQNIHRFYHERQPSRRPSRQSLEAYPTICSWFDQQWEGSMLELVESGGCTVGEIFRPNFDKELPKLERFLKKYEDHQHQLAVMREATRLLPLPISGAILEYT